MIQNATYEPVRPIRTSLPIINIVIILICFTAGAFGYYAAYRYGLFNAAGTLALTFGRLLYDKIGFVVFALLPLSFFLAGVVVLVALENTGRYLFTNSPTAKLDFVMEVAPMLGIVGTMVSLSNAMISVDIAQGVQNAIHHLTSLVGQALNSSIYGIALAITAFLAKSLCHAKWKRSERHNENASISV